MRTIEIQAYQFSELSEEAQERAMQWYRNGQCIDLDLEHCKEILIENGYLNPKIEYSGFCSQGDGASFMADIDTGEFLLGKYHSLNGVDFELKIVSINSHYCHERTKRIEAFIYHATEEQIKLITELETELELSRYELCRTIYNWLEADYDYQTSDEYITECLIANEYEFDETGKAI